MNARVHQSVHTVQHVPSYYAAALNRRIECPPLTGEEQAGVCAAGGGFSGMNTVLELAQRGLSMVLLEAHRIDQGANGHNGGQLIRGADHDVEQFPPVIGANDVRALKLMGLEAVEIARRRVEQYAADCDLRWGCYDLASGPGDYQGFREGMEELQAFGYRHKMHLVPAAEIRSVADFDRYVGSLVDMGSGHLCPLNLVLGEAIAAQSLDARLFERSPMTRVDYSAEIQIHTAADKVRAETLVLGYNAYMNNLNPLLGSKVLPAGSYVIATEPLNKQLARQLLPQNMAVCDRHVALDCYRLSTDDRLLFGDACHYSGHDPSDIAAYMRPKMLETFPQLANVRINYQWGDVIDIDANRLLQIGRLPGQPNVYFAQTYSGHGMSATYLAGQLLAKAVGGQQNDDFDLFVRVSHITFLGDKLLRSPLLALGVAWYRLKEKLDS